MPSATTFRTPAQVVSRHWRAGCKEILHAQFGGGPTEQARATETSLAAYPTSWTAWRALEMMAQQRLRLLLNSNREGIYRASVL